MRRIIRANGVQKGTNEILNIFFGVSKGELPEKYLSLHREYLNELGGGGCSSCKKNSVQKKYKRKILELD